MCEEDIVAAFAGASAEDCTELAQNINLLKDDLNTLRKACHNVWIAGWAARVARQDGKNPDKVRELDERAVEEAKAAKAAAANARVKMDNLKLKLELYEL